MFWLSVFCFWGDDDEEVVMYVFDVVGMSYMVVCDWFILLGGEC